MSKARLQAATVGGTPDEVEQLFYEARRTGDVRALMACWAEEDEIVCVLAAGSRWIGPGAIQAGFASVSSKGQGLKTGSVHRIHALASAVHHLIERHERDGEEPVWTIATNVFHKTPQGWRLVAHHSSPATVQEVAQAMDVPKVLH